MPPPSAAEVAAAQSRGLTAGDATVPDGLDETGGESPAGADELAAEHALTGRTAIAAMTFIANRISYLAW
jgi:hypothetical protein